jgi:hypothetical protein
LQKEQDIMKNFRTFDSIANAARRALCGPMLALAVLLLPGLAAAQNKSGWSINFTPVVLFPKDEYRFGGGADPELKYTLDLGGARLSAGGRVGTYYAKNLFGVTVMPTLRLMVPVGPVEPYVAFGMGYGWLPRNGYADFAMMSRLGVVFRFSKSFAIGLEGTVQKLDGSNFRFPSFGSMLSLDL